MSAASAKRQDVEVEDFAALFAESLKESDVQEGSVTKGRVVAIENDVVTIDVGVKSEGRVPLREFNRAVGDELRVGDEVEVFIERIENRMGEVVLSREKALREEAWEKLEKAYTGQKHVEGTIFGKVKGGFTVDLAGAVAFLPGSQVDIRPIKDVSPLLGIPQPFQILKMDRKRGNIVVSRRAVLEESRQGQREELLAKIKEGDTLEGVVKNITDYGAFIDMGGVDGLLHVTDISWSRINHPSEVFAIGDSIKVMVTKYDPETKRISLGMKQLEENPWKGVEEVYKAGTKFTGRVSNITDYGAFIELDKGIEGLVHVSEMSWTKKNVHPSKIIAVGQEVEVMVLDIDSQKHRISLGIKQCEENPWASFGEKNKENDTIEGTVKNITEFGLFIGLNGEIDGLVHHSDIKWGESGETAVKDYKKGDTIQAKILLIDVEKERVSLGIKQLTEKPAGTKDDAPAEKTAAASTKGGDTGKGKKGTVVTCTVTEVESNGIAVSLEDDMKGYIKKAELSRERKEQRPERFSVGDRVDAKIITIDGRGEVGLSIKSLENDQHKQAIADFGSTDSGASLGDILGAALENAETKTKKKPAKSKAE